MPDDLTPLDDGTLFQICRVSQEDLEAMPALGDELLLARRLIPPPRARHDGRLENALTLLASAMGRMKQYNPAHLPFGYQGPTITSCGWIDRDDLELVAKQIVGLTWPDSAPDKMAGVVSSAVSQAVKIGLLEQKEYDAWRPGMASGSGWRSAVSATTYGVAKARAMGERQVDATAQPVASSPPVQRLTQDPPWARQPKPEVDDDRAEVKEAAPAQAPRDLISRKTRIEFREFLVGWTLREISDEFDAAEIKRDASFVPNVSGQRRSLVEQYYQTLSFTSQVDVGKLVRAYENILTSALNKAAKLESGTYPDPTQAANLRQAVHGLCSWLEKDGFSFENGRITPICAVAGKVIDEPVARTISEVTRQDIFDALRLTNVQWAGRLSEIRFLKRLYDLDSIPSKESRFTEGVAEEIWQHRVNNPEDWPDDWVFTDSRFRLADGPDELLLRFLCEMIHPLVRPDADAVEELLTIFNTHLAADGWEIIRCREVSGRPVFGPSRIAPLLGSGTAEPSTVTGPMDPRSGHAQRVDPAWDRAPFDLPELDEYRRLSPLNFATILDRWESAVEKVSQALLEGNTEQVRALMENCSLEKMSALVRLAMEDRGIASDAIIRLCEVFGRAAAGFQVKMESALLDEPAAATERLKTKLALELKTAGEPPRDAPSVAAPLATCLDALVEVVDRHRLIFLYCATASRINPRERNGATAGWERVVKENILGWPALGKDDDTDPEGQFLLKYRNLLDRYAAEALSRFGHDEGSKPKMLTTEGNLVDVEGGSLPFWEMEGWCVRELEESSNRILATCRKAVEVDQGIRLRVTIQHVLAVVHDKDQHRWYPSVMVRWQYLGELDEVIAELKSLQVGSDSWTRGEEGGESRVSGTTRAVSAGRKSAPRPSSTSTPNPKEYRARMLALAEARGLFKADAAGQGVLPPGADGAKSLSVEDAASMVAAELDVWVEAVADAEADTNPSGGYWTVLNTDLEDMLGPAELGAGILQDTWTPLLTGLRLRGQHELAQELARLAKNVVPKATQLARDIDAVAYLSHGGPKDALYKAYARGDLVTYRASVLQGRRDAMRDVKTISGILRTLSASGKAALAPEEAVPDKATRSRSESQQTTTVELPAPPEECYGEIDVRSADKGFLRVLFSRKNTDGRPTAVCAPIPVEGQLLGILVAGRELAMRRLREADDALPGGGLPDDYKTVLEWTQDSLCDLVKGNAGARRGAIARLRRLVKFQNGDGLVSKKKDAGGAWTSTIQFRLRTSSTP